MKHIVLGVGGFLAGSIIAVASGLTGWVVCALGLFGAGVFIVGWSDLLG